MMRSYAAYREMHGLIDELLLEGLHVVAVHVCIPQDMHEFASLEPAYLGNHACKEGIAGDVEGHPKSQIARALIHLTRQLAFRHVKLQYRVGIKCRWGDNRKKMPQ